MQKVNIRLFENSEWSDYRHIRLRALQDSPDSFGSKFEITNLLSDAQWLGRLESAQPECDLPLAALVNNNFAGMAWARFENPGDSVAHLFQMWVAPEYRGYGVGRQLLHCAIKWAQGRDAESLALSVTCGESPARKLYDSMGFLPTGELKPLRPNSKLMVQPMEILLSDTSS